MRNISYLNNLLDISFTFWLKSSIFEHDSCISKLSNVESIALPFDTSKWDEDVLERLRTLPDYVRNVLNL